MTGAAAFRGILPQQDLFDPGVHREGTDMVQTEEADAVGNFDAYSVAGEKSFHGGGHSTGTLKDSYGNEIACYTAPFDGVVLYYTLSLGVKSGDPLIAYGKL